MAQMPDIEVFAAEPGLKIITGERLLSSNADNERYLKTKLVKLAHLL